MKYVCHVCGYTDDVDRHTFFHKCDPKASPNTAAMTDPLREEFEAWAAHTFGTSWLERADQDRGGDRLTYCEIRTRSAWAAWQAARASAPAASPDAEREKSPPHYCGLQGFGALGDVCPACAANRAEYDAARQSLPVAKDQP